MILLAIDTATESCSVALCDNGKIYHRSTVQARKHAELVLPFIDEVLNEAGINKSQIQGLIVGQGPGAFTGVRIGVGVAQGIALALDIPVVAVSNLQTLAYSAYQQLNTTDKKTIIVASDARMNEVYWAKFICDKTQINRIGNELVSKAADVNLANIDCHIGSGFNVYPELISYNNSNSMPFKVDSFSQAKDMLSMIKNKFSNLAQSIKVVEPVYLREP